MTMLPPTRADDPAGNASILPRDSWDATGAGYDEIAQSFRPAVDALLRCLPIKSGMRILDAACGTGIVALAAAREEAQVIGIDFAPALIRAAKQIALEEDLSSHVAFLVGDVEHIPLLDASFDAVISNFGMIFAPNHDRVVSEMARVLRPEGMLAFTAWTPEGPNLRLMTITSRYAPPSSDSRFGVFDWGCEDHIVSMLTPWFHTISLHAANVPWICSSVTEAIDMVLYRSLGPTVTAFRSADLATRLCIHRDCIALFADCLLDDGSVRLDRQYVTVRAVRRA
jgi:ubiquinone/menaquinone biosynthesis C-methylase UbiE